MRSVKFACGSVALALALGAAPAMADEGRTMSGTTKGMSWTAQSTIVGQTSTATVASGGNPIYTAPQPQKSGVTALIMQYANGSAYICSGSLLADRGSILTAAHCASDGQGNRPTAITAYFYGGPNPDTVVTNDPAATAAKVSGYFINPLYTGEVIDQNDIAVFKLADGAPAFAKAYDLYTGSDLTGLGFTVDGYGGRSDTGGAVGNNLGTGRLREGDNRYDFRFGDPQFGGFFTDRDPSTGQRFFGNADVSYSWLSDFDNGTTQNDASCALGGAFGITSAQFCNTGVGAREVGIAGGDSGGPEFVNGKIASVSSYSLVFGNNNLGADYKPGLNSSWGEFNGFAPVFTSLGFIAQASAAPEPATWLSMILGFGLLGTTLRRRKAGEQGALARA